MEWHEREATLTEQRLVVAGKQVMDRWEEPLMRQLARAAVRAPSDRVLEVGYGMGISASFVREFLERPHEVVEAHPQMAQAARDAGYTVYEGYWPHAAPKECEVYDAILFDPFDLDDSLPVWDWQREHLTTFKRLLKPGGVLTYYSGETRNFDPLHLSFLLEHWSSVELKLCTGLRPPPDCDYWNNTEMVVPACRK